MLQMKAKLLEEERRVARVRLACGVLAELHACMQPLTRSLSHGPFQEEAELEEQQRLENLQSEQLRLALAEKEVGQSSGVPS